MAPLYVLQLPGGEEPGQARTLSGSPAANGGGVSSGGVPVRIGVESLVKMVVEQVLHTSLSDDGGLTPVQVGAELKVQAFGVSLMLHGTHG